MIKVLIIILLTAGSLKSQTLDITYNNKQRTTLEEINIQSLQVFNPDSIFILGKVIGLEGTKTGLLHISLRQLCIIEHNFEKIEEGNPLYDLRKFLIDSMKNNCYSKTKLPQGVTKYYRYIKTVNL
jgi:hypothetical protein